LSDSELQSLEDWITPLIRQLSSSQRRKLARKVATDLRRSQVARIRAQQNPDGSAYAPRRQSDASRGRIRRRAMFTGLRSTRYLRMQTSPNEASIGFTGRVARIVRVHQEGLRDRVQPGGPYHDYDQRIILGYSQADRNLIRESLLNHLKDV
jgi:phage virion morphogenesis protein